MLVQSNPAEAAVEVVPGVDELPILARGLYVGVGGSITGQLVGMPDGKTVTFLGLAGGVVHPLAFKRITGGTASGLVAVR